MSAPRLACCLRNVSSVGSAVTEMKPTWTVADSSETGPLRGQARSAPVSFMAIALLAVPILIQGLLVAQRLINWLPVWAWYPDPGYQYLFAGGSLVTGGSSDLIYHPGTSLQWLIGLSQVMTHVLVGHSDLMLDIAARPELYAQSTGIVLGVLYVSAVAFAGWRMLKYWGFWPALLFQILLLWGLPILAAGRFVLWPESLILTAAIFVLALLAPQLRGLDPDKERAQAVVLALACSIGLTAKITFAPFLMIAVVLIRWRYLAWFLIPFVCATALTLIPVYSRFESMQTWFLQISTNPGRHGQAGSWDPVGNFVNSMVMTNAVVRWFIPVSLAVVILALATLILPVRAHLRILVPTLALVVAASLVVASGLKDSETRDFILAIPLVAALASLTFLRLLNATRNPLRRIMSLTVIAVGVFLAAHGVVQEQNFHSGTQLNVDGTVRNAELVDGLDGEARWASGYNAWTFDSSRIFGLIWSAGSFNREVRSINSEALHFDLFNREILHVNESNELLPLTCGEINDIVTGQGLGIVVESQGHIALSDDSSQILLKPGAADFSGPERVGDYFAYRLTGITCEV